MLHMLVLVLKLSRVCRIALHVQLWRTLRVRSLADVSMPTSMRVAGVVNGTVNKRNRYKVATSVQHISINCV
jgi:hypothetical protein